MNDLARNLLLWLVVAVVLTMVFQNFSPGTAASGNVPYSNFIEELRDGRVKDVMIESDRMTMQVTRSDGTKFVTIKTEDRDLTNELLAKGVVINQEPPAQTSLLMSLIFSLLPVFLILAVMVYFMRQMQQGGGKGAMSFGRSKAKLMSEDQIKVNFTDVAGCDEAKEEVGELVEFLRDPGKFQKLGGKIPRGVLMVGPPGTGKTLLARAIAGEAKVPFYSISGSDFVEMFVGVGASRVRDMFEQGKKNAPCIIFIDEIDAVGRHRGAGLGGGNDEREQTLNQMLVEMDGFESNEGVIIIAATNRPDVLDPALLRPGRFDRQVVVPNPDVNGREKILRVHMRKVPLASDVDPKVIARGTPGFSGADLANLVNEGALLAARTGRRTVGMAELEAAKDKVMMGAERRSLVMSEDEKRMTAYHEAGHALVAVHEPECDPVHKATIIPRGRALGLVMSLPAGDRYSKHKSKLKAELAMAMGGRVAEELIFGADKVSNGASGDIKMATDQSRRMVTEWGMSDNLGMIAYGSNDQEVFLGHSVTQSKNLSEETARKIDAEIRSIIDAAYARATKVLSENIDELHLLAKGLLEYETVSGDEIRQIIKGEALVRTRPDEPVNQGRGSVPSSGRPDPRPSTGPWSGQPAPGI